VRFTAREAVMNLIIQLVEYTRAVAPRGLADHIPATCAAGQERQLLKGEQIPETPMEELS
jgi:hypothetical protein